MTKKTSTVLGRRGSLGRKDKDRPGLGLRGKSPDVVREQLLKNTAAAKSTEPDYLRDRTVTDLSRKTSSVYSYIVRNAGEHWEAAQRHAQKYEVSTQFPVKLKGSTFDLRRVIVETPNREGKSSAPGELDLWPKMYRPDVENFVIIEPKIPQVSQTTAAALVHSVWSKDLASETQHYVPIHREAPSLAFHPLNLHEGRSAKTPELTDPLFNFELHQLEGTDMTQFASPEGERPVALPDWPSNLRTNPYKL